MTPLFWIALTWVLATALVGRLPRHQRTIPGALLMVSAVPIILSMGFQVGWSLAVLGVIALVSLFPNLLRLMLARYRGETVKPDTDILRFLVVPDDLWKVGNMKGRGQ